MLRILVVEDQDESIIFKISDSSYMFPPPPWKNICGLYYSGLQKKN